MMLSSQEIAHEGERVLLDAKATDPQVILEHLARYVFATRFIKGGRVLDLACGSGYGAFFLKNAGALEVVGSDIDLGALDYARRHYQASGLRYEGGGLDRLLEQDEKFDLITSFETIEHVPEPENFLRGLARCLKPDGVLLVSTPFRLAENVVNGRPANPHHLREWSFAEFAALAGKVFSKAQWYTQGLRIIKGRFPFSRTLRSAKVYAFYDGPQVRAPRGLNDVAVVPFPVLYADLCEGKNMTAVCFARDLLEAGSAS